MHKYVIFNFFLFLYVFSLSLQASLFFVSGLLLFMAFSSIFSTDLHGIDLNRFRIERLIVLCHFMPWLQLWFTEQVTVLTEIFLLNFISKIKGGGGEENHHFILSWENPC